MQLDYLVKPSKSNDGAFVLASSSRKDVKERIRNSGQIISDLDYTLIDSPTFRLVVQRFFEGGFLDIRQDIWAVKAIFKYILDGETAVPPMWLEYRSKFEDGFRSYISSRKINPSFYPGVQEFFSSFQETAEKIMVTRTFPEIAGPFADYLGFSKWRSFRDNKMPVLEEIKCSSQDMLIGDSAEDEAIIDELEKSRICPLTVHVASSPKKANEKFAVIIGRNYRGLNEILNSD